MKSVRKAVLPVAGLGTRVLPASKATTKNLLNVVDLLVPELQRRGRFRTAYSGGTLLDNIRQTGG